MMTNHDGECELTVKFTDNEREVLRDAAFHE
jgi:hypothetical protein